MKTKKDLVKRGIVLLFCSFLIALAGCSGKKDDPKPNQNSPSLPAAGSYMLYTKGGARVIQVNCYDSMYLGISSNGSAQLTSGCLVTNETGTVSSSGNSLTIDISGTGYAYPFKGPVTVGQDGSLTINNTADNTTYVFNVSTLASN